MAETPDPQILAFESECAAAGVDPVDVLARAGTHRSTWFRWKKGKVSPTLRSFQAARVALADMVRTDRAA